MSVAMRKEQSPASRPPTTAREEDFQAWLGEQAHALHAREASRVDWDALAEELEEMAASERREVIRHFRRLLSSLLKWTYSATKRSERSWQISIRGARQDLSLMFASKVLRNDAPASVATAYKQASALAADEMRLTKFEAQKLFPKICPWTLEQLLDEGFLPAIAPSANGRSR